MAQDKLFLIVRSDLPVPGALIAQSAHALRLFVAEHPEVDRAWYEDSNNLVCLEVPDEAALDALVQRADAAEVAVSGFREPDYGDQLTAIALGPAGWRLVSNLPLALRDAA